MEHRIPFQTCRRTQTCLVLCGIATPCQVGYDRGAHRNGEINTSHDGTNRRLHGSVPD